MLARRRRFARLLQLCAAPRQVELTGQAEKMGISAESSQRFLDFALILAAARPRPRAATAATRRRTAVRAVSSRSQLMRSVGTGSYASGGGGGNDGFGTGSYGAGGESSGFGFSSGGGGGSRACHKCVGHFPECADDAAAASRATCRGPLLARSMLLTTQRLPAALDSRRAQVLQVRSTLRHRR